MTRLLRVPPRTLLAARGGPSACGPAYRPNGAGRHAQAGAGPAPVSGDMGSLLGYQAICLVAVATPLALAEGVWRYWFLALLAAGLATWTDLRHRRRLLRPSVGHGLVIVAFLLLVFEYAVLLALPIMAISHFMVLVCACKLLHHQTRRDEAQVFVLCLLLLVVAALVSGSVLFVAVLVVYLTVALAGLLQFHLLAEQTRRDHWNLRAIGAGPAPPTSHVLLGRRSAAGVAVLAGLTGLGIGGAIFVLCPRVGAGMFGQLDAHTSGFAVTGLSSTLAFDRVGPIVPSDREVMTVRLVDTQGRPYLVSDFQPLFRAAVFDRYSRPSGLAGRWEWRNTTDQPLPSARVILRQSDDSVTGRITLLTAQPARPSAESPHPTGPAVVQQYRVQPTDHSYLFTCYPALQVSSRDFDELHKNLDDQVLSLTAKPRGPLRYEVVTPVRLSPVVIEELARDRGESLPAVWPPDPPLPREADIRDLIAREIDEPTGTAGPLDDPAKRSRFLAAVETYLRSSRFSYTLDPPGPTAPGAEPIGEFLIRDRRGHCEYFAAAMAVVCQYRGVPARVVCGYRGTDYNPVGGHYLIRERDAHLWVEAFIPGRDWVTYDPTPGLEPYLPARRWWMLGLYRYLDYLQFQWSNLVVAYDSELRGELLAKFEDWLRRPTGHQRTVAAAVAAFVRELFWWRIDLSLYDRLLYWVFAVMVLALVILTGYVLVCLLAHLASALWHRWTARVRLRAADGVDFYHRFCRRAASLGLHRRPDQTPAEFADELARRFHCLAAAPSLVAAYYQVTFGRQPLSPVQQNRINALLDQLRSVRPDRLVPPSVPSASSS